MHSVQEVRMLLRYVRSDIFTPVIMNPGFWNLMSCSRLKDNRRFRGTYRPRLYNRRTNHTWNQREADSKHSLKVEVTCSPKRQLKLMDDMTLYPGRFIITFMTAENFSHIEYDMENFL